MEPVAQFWVEADALATGAAVTRREPNGHAELFIHTPNGTLEVSGKQEFVSVACGSLFIEDRPVRSIDDANFLLAICDSVLAGRATVTESRARAELLTRGYSQVWTA